MRAPITHNSITERVHFTGLYVPEEVSEPTQESADREPREFHPQAGAAEPIQA
jgi:hypothetical protein